MHGRLLNEIATFLYPHRIDHQYTHIIGEGLLRAANIHADIKSSSFLPSNTYPEREVVLTIRGINEEEKDRFLAYLQKNLTDIEITIEINYFHSTNRCIENKERRAGHSTGYTFKLNSENIHQQLLSQFIKGFEQIPQERLAVLKANSLNKAKKSEPSFISSLFPPPKGEVQEEAEVKEEIKEEIKIKAEKAPVVRNSMLNHGL